MQIQVNTDKHVQGGADLTSEVEAVVESALGRFGDWITRVEVQLSDEAGPKNRGDGKRCVMEARPAGLQPVSASHEGATVDQALKGSAKKLARLLDDTKARLEGPRGTAPSPANRPPELNPEERTNP